MIEGVETNQTPDAAGARAAPHCPRCQKDSLHGVACVLPVAGGLNAANEPRGDSWCCIACGHEWPMMTTEAPTMH